MTTPLIPRGRSLGDVFSPRSNSLNAIRLLLATLVIVSHSWPAGDFGEDPRLGDQDLGDWAVASFFVISGYLITASRLSSKGLLTYLWKRALRIYPGYFVALVFVALVAAPVSTLFTGVYFSAPESLAFLVKNLTLLVLEPTIGTTLADAPVSNTWNAPLWTLAYEAACYVFVGLLVSLVPRRFLLHAVIAATVICSVVVALVVYGELNLPTVVLKGFRLGAFFAAGAVVFVLRHRLSSKWHWAALSGCFVVITVLTSTFQALAPLPLAYLLLWLGARQTLRSVGSKYDLSYGMYIYAFPLQQLLQLAAPDLGSPFVFAVVSIVLTVPLAYLSCRFVEQPALRLKPTGGRARLRVSSR